MNQDIVRAELAQLKQERRELINRYGVGERWNTQSAERLREINQRILEINSKLD